MSTTIASSPVAAVPTSKGTKIAGWVLSTIVILFLTLDAVMKFVKPEAVVKTTVQLGYPESSIVVLGLILIVSVLLYAIPRTALLGAVLLTGYLGGAVAAHVRIGNPLFGYILFPVYLGILVWGGLYLRNARLRALFPFAR